MAKHFCWGWRWRRRATSGVSRSLPPIGIRKRERWSLRLSLRKIPPRKRTGRIRSSRRRAKPTPGAGRFHPGFPEQPLQFLIAGSRGGGLLPAQLGEILVVVCPGLVIDEIQYLLQVRAGVPVALFELDGEAHAGIGTNHAAFDVAPAHADVGQIA